MQTQNQKILVPYLLVVVMEEYLFLLVLIEKQLAQKEIMRFFLGFVSQVLIVIS
jgi:hypothetical protein